MQQSKESSKGTHHSNEEVDLFGVLEVLVFDLMSAESYAYNWNRTKYALMTMMVTRDPCIRGRTCSSATNPDPIDDVIFIPRGTLAKTKMMFGSIERRRVNSRGRFSQAYLCLCFQETSYQSCTITFS